MSSEPDKVALAAIEARDNVRLIREWSAGQDLEAIRADRKTRYAIERAFIAIDAAVRDIPTEVLAAHGIPAKMIAGFRNALAHTYDDILDERVMLTISDDLPALDAALARILETR
ncbi:HepT-like ribonuclease domain-containing protein [Bradyrhizobium sp.]|uniref:HepT-like ribonuclease domain-containing protein n=1 Tax=Bradyrhizobium sp. TaxID=376 RepID=UPI0040376F30